MRTQVIITILALATLSNAFMLNQTPRPGGPGKLLRAKQASNNAAGGNTATTPTTDSTATTTDSTATTSTAQSLVQGIQQGSSGQATGSQAGLSSQANQLISQLTPAQQSQLRHLTLVAQEIKNASSGDLLAQVNKLVSQLSQEQQKEVINIYEAQEDKTASCKLKTQQAYLNSHIEELVFKFFSSKQTEVKDHETEVKPVAQTTDAEFFSRAFRKIKSVTKKATSSIKKATNNVKHVANKVKHVANKVKDVAKKVADKSLDGLIEVTGIAGNLTFDAVYGSAKQLGLEDKFLAAACDNTPMPVFLVIGRSKKFLSNKAISKVHAKETSTL